MQKKFETTKSRMEKIDLNRFKSVLISLKIKKKDWKKAFKLI